MKEKEALKRFCPTTTTGEIHDLERLDFIKTLYKQGYVILTPEELKKVNSCIVLADVHGMNPFAPGGKS